VVVALGPLVSVVLWTQNDARARRMATVQDWGLFVYLLWPILVPWHIVQTRGRGAWPLALRLCGAIVAPFAAIIIGVVIGAVLRALAR